jgi:hypothetical protein
METDLRTGRKKEALRGVARLIQIALAITRNTAAEQV